MKRVPAVFVACALFVLLTLTGRGTSAPAPKDKEPKPDGPITPELLLKSSNKLKRIALAFHNYNDKIGELPGNQMSKSLWQN
jgi:hypothetical protein